MTLEETRKYIAQVRKELETHPRSVQHYKVMTSIIDSEFSAGEKMEIWMLGLALFDTDAEKARTTE